ncbi:MAG: hypothetical protein R3D86_13555 [Emcibacteraceae bacterium]
MSSPSPYLKNDNFRIQIADEFNDYLKEQENRFHSDDCLFVDLHCHDENSDIPDELWGRF